MESRVCFHFAVSVLALFGCWVQPSVQGKSVLASNEALRSGEYLVAPNNAAFVILQGDGNLVVYKGSGPNANTGVVLWSSDTAGKGSTSLIMQGDCNLVLYKGNIPVWNSNTVQTGGGTCTAVMQDDLTFVVYKNGAQLLWRSPGGCVLYPNQILRAGQYLTANNRAAFAVMQGDGNLVVYKGSGLGDKRAVALWSSQTAGKGNSQLVLQSDCNLVVYSGNKPTWFSNTVQKDGSCTAVLQDDMNFVVYKNGNQALWSFKGGLVRPPAVPPRRPPPIYIPIFSGGTLLSKSLSVGDLTEDQTKFYAHGINHKRIAYIHGNGICHLDIKGENVFLKEHHTVKIGDFGEIIKLQLSVAHSLRRPTSGRFSTITDKWPLVTFIGNGGQPELPKVMSVDLRELLMLCLKSEPRQRPTAQELQQHAGSWSRLNEFNDQTKAVIVPHVVEAAREKIRTSRTCIHLVSPVDAGLRVYTRRGAST